MLIPHLLFAHMLADYALQTNWLVARKGQGWDGLILHGLVVFVMSLLVLPRYIPVLFVPILAMSVLHTIQDWLKVYSGPRLKIHPFIPYTLDQVLHYITVLGMQVLFGPLLQPPPDPGEILIMSAGTVIIAATRFYDVTWWANWLDMIPYMNRWRVWGYVERLAMVALAVVGWYFLAPLCVVPRVWYAQRCGSPVWQQQRGILEVIVGIVFSVALGLVLRALIVI